MRRSYLRTISSRSAAPGKHRRADIRKSKDSSTVAKAQNAALAAAQLELEDARARYAELYDEAPVGYVSLSSVGHIEEANLVAARMLGFSRRQLLRQPLMIFIEREDRRRFIKFLTELRKLGGRRSVELRLARKPGALPVFVEVVSTLSSGRKGPVRVQTALVDITARRLAEVELRESEERFRLLASHAPVGIFLCDVDGNNCYVNEYWCNLTGLTPAQARGQGWLNGVHPEDRMRLEEILSKVKARREGDSVAAEFRFVRQDGGVVWVHAQVNQLKGVLGQCTGWIGTVADVTVRKRMENNMSLAHTEMVAAARAKDDFLAMLSHELRTPLNPVLLLASDDARDRELPPGVRADFDAIRRNVEMVARLIDDLLDITRITHGKLAIEKHPLEVHDILHSAIEMVESDIERKKLQIKLALHATRQTVSGDQIRLQQVFLNILKNAIKFTPEHGNVFVETGTENGSLVVKITDTGIGISPENVETIFDAFCQGEQANRGLGLGLGLAISKRLVEMHGGSIEATSLGKDSGATFSITLPLVHAARAVAQAVQQPALSDVRPQREKKPARRSRILLVEDHEPTRAALTRLLLRRSFEVTGAGSVAEAHTHVDKAQQEFDLLISDIGLPDGNGYDLMNQLRKKHKLAGIALTGYGMEEDVQRSHDAGFATHLTKPVKIESLDQALSTVLQRA